uniref:Mitochondrial import inner membrane translocase subunit n=1 Tax=Romanomermis culicivorax TaxID=13658 RepID=A0A915KEL1_ROMCU
MSDTCKNKCISSDYKEGDLKKGEAVCVDRCVAKYLQVHEDLGKRLSQMTQQDEQTMQKLQHQNPLS